jgi:hypothetical protein
MKYYGGKKCMYECKHTDRSNRSVSNQCSYDKEYNKKENCEKI